MERSLLEYTDSRGLSLGVDCESGVIRGVKILGMESRNGRVYSQAALEQARELYEGAKVNVNHPKGNPLGPREYQDRIGVIRNVLPVTESGLFGDLHFNPRHLLAGQLEWDARHAPENVGLSHNVLARTTKRDDCLVVEAITRVVSVDLVADPATTHGLFEEIDPAAASTQLPVLTGVTLETLRERRPDLAIALEEPLRTELTGLREEISHLRTVEVAQRKQLLGIRLLQEYGSAGDEPLLEMLITLEDEAAMRRLLHERASTSGRRDVPPAGPRCRDQHLVERRESLVPDAATFVRLISD